MFEAIHFTNRHGERLDVSFHHGDKNDRLVILGHGVTGDKDRPLLVAVAEGLAAAGWSCLRMSFAGNGHSEGDFRAATISKESARCERREHDPISSLASTSQSQSPCSLEAARWPQRNDSECGPRALTRRRFHE